MTGPSSSGSANQPTCAVELTGISKRFGPVQALAEVNLSVKHGEVHAVLGENGAGKSTLIKILTGVYTPDAGTITVNDREVELRTPRAALRAGISLVPQDIMFVPGLSVGRNILLGNEGFFARKERLPAKERDNANGMLGQAGATFSSTGRAGDLSVPELRLMQIARTLSHPGDVVVFDEPTAVLSESDAEALLERIETFKAQGKAIVYVTHRLSEVMRIADRVTILRDGVQVGTFDRQDIDTARIIELMSKVTAAPAASLEHVGELLADHDDTATRGRTENLPEAGEVLASVDGLSVGRLVHDVSLQLRAGQIVGIAGVQGSGHGHLLRAIAGWLRPTSGSVHLRGRKLRNGSTADAYRNGAVLVPADRRGAGVVVGMSIAENLALPVKADASTRRFGLRHRRSETSIARRYIEQFAVRTSGALQHVGQLSGGNQQKVSLARALEGRPSLLLIDEPTQGVDVNAKAEIRSAISGLAAEGSAAVLIASSEFEDLLGLVDTIHVMRSGRLVATYDGRTVTYQQLLASALG